MPKVTSGYIELQSDCNRKNTIIEQNERNCIRLQELRVLIYLLLIERERVMHKVKGVVFHVTM